MNSQTADRPDDADARGFPAVDGLLLDQLVNDGNQDAFANLVKRHGPYVLSVCRHLTSHTQDAEDIFQACFLELVRRAGSIRERNALAEFLNIEKPTTGSGAGVSIYITMVSPTKEAATIGRSIQPNGEQIVNAHHATTPADGKRQHSSDAAATEAPSGRLRLARSVVPLSYQFAPGESETFRELRSVELGAADLEMVRFAVGKGGSPTAVDVRIKSVSIKANDLGSARQPPTRRARWPWWLGGGLTLLVLATGGYWYWSRKQGAEA